MCLPPNALRIRHHCSAYFNSALKKPHLRPTLAALPLLVGFNPGCHWKSVTLAMIMSNALPLGCYSFMQIRINGAASKLGLNINGYFVNHR
ncbi:hypothetical protein CEXT_589031 [Caerostris extrusa]|uniref:Uncharacterized protein n=1 Tax=Caerostris extrusa TaxID=172846 RepID=A0AAV4TQA7_CAEEX|nr:hypothetical protein CEXT_589031 [Caerostris extrusa]